ncbi:MAG: pectate lyase [Ignavibacteriae bacterium]|nr:MAG: pectate lyase [Ignavibacteriota bacterium]
MLLLSAIKIHSQPLAFPGAEGYGRFALGGRGGKVIEVTNLNDAGPGSFRQACNVKGPRVIIFKISGTIDLQKPVTIREPYVTIAGQTAPGDGICLKRSSLDIEAHNVIVRYIRSRPGNLYGSQMDAITIGGDAHDVIIDHCSATWSVDECLSPSGGISSITVQWCLIGEALNKSVHKKGAHGFGSLVRANGGVTLHHNLWLKNNARNPRLGDNYGKLPWPTFDVRNNVIYNWGNICSGMTGDRLNANYVSNYLRPGPQSSAYPPIVLTKTARVTFYLHGNVVEGRPEQTIIPLALFRSSNGKIQGEVTIVDTPTVVSTVATTSAEVAYRDVLAHVGAVCPQRDAVDSRLIHEVTEGIGRIIDSQDEVGGWPELKSLAAPGDSDHDGITDEWEKSNGLNPLDSNDGAIYTLSKDYTNIEMYLESLLK